jgi:phage host-nuclease inhibitor protein Gam
MKFEALTITDSTLREELIAYVNDLEDEVQRLEVKVEDQNQEIEDLPLAPQIKERLSDAAELMAGLGRIHNTPHAKAQWINGN